jgi:hypothetical protein
MHNKSRNLRWIREAFFQGDLTAEKPGAEPRAMVPMVGNWAIVVENDRNLLKVDGTRWQEGQSGANLAD